MRPSYLSWFAAACFLQLLGSSCAILKGQSQNRMLGGTAVTDVKQFPYLVLLDLGAGKHCSGTIISQTAVLSAAQCDGDDITAYAGLVDIAKKDDAGVQERKVSSTLKPSVDGKDVKFFIMICKIDKPWEWTEFVKEVSLYNETSESSTSMSCKVIGFGEIDGTAKSGVAHFMEQMIHKDVSTCAAAADPPAGGGGDFRTNKQVITDTAEILLCSTDAVGTKTTCKGDEGGAAVCDNKQWGVILHGGGACDATVAYNLYSDVGYFRDWILENSDIASAADSLHCRLLQVSMYKVLLYTPLWVLLYLH